MNPVPLSQIGKIVTGKTPKTSHEDFFGGEIPFVTPSDMDTRRIISQTARTLSEDGVASVKNSVVPAGAVMVSCIGSDMGKTYLAGKRSVTNQQINTVIVDERKFSPLFIYYNLFGRRKELREKAAGAAQPILNKTEFGKIIVDVPNLAEQREIASILGALDDKIELNRRMAATLEEMARALYRSWFVDFDPVKAKAEGLAPAFMDETTAALFPDRFGDDGLPEGWRMGCVTDVFDVVMGQSPPGNTYNDRGEGLPFYQGRTDFGFRFPSQRVFCSAPTRIAPRDSVLLSVRAPVGDLNRAWEECCIGRGVASLSEKEGRNAYGYEALWALSEDLKAYDSEGTVFGAINKNQLTGLPLIIPPNSMRAAFEERVRPMDDRIRNVTAETRTLTALRDSLLPKLMSGELRVGEARDQIEEVA